VGTPASWLRHPRQRFHAWLGSRLPRTDTIELTQRNVYILPTRPGWMLGVTLLVMLLSSINYQLNLGYLLTFLLAGSAVVGMHVSHATLRGLTLRLTPPEPGFAGAAIRLHVALSSQRNQTRWGIAVAVLSAPGATATHTTPDHTDWAHVDVPPGGSASVEVTWQPPSRGRHALPAITAETRFPLGTFRVWTVWRPAAQVLVYPKPEAHPPPLPTSTPRPGTTAASQATRSGEFDGVRPYRSGDPLKSVVWKRSAQAAARGSTDLVSRDHRSSQQQELWLDWTHTGASHPEQRLSRLTAWVLLADRLGLDYGLRLPDREWPPAQGAAHRQQCLEGLALC
jgi:uncharacterized protein (DUF58 family)